MDGYAAPQEIRFEDRPLAKSEVRSWQGKWVFDSTGETIGKIADVLVGPDSRPEWMVVSMGAFLHNDRPLPVFDMRDSDNGFVVSYSKDMVQKAPSVNWVDLSEKDEQELHSYWCQVGTPAMPRACTLLSSR